MQWNSKVQSNSTLRIMKLWKDNIYSYTSMNVMEIDHIHRTYDHNNLTKRHDENFKRDENEA
jgi:hypothetical protein